MLEKDLQNYISANDLANKYHVRKAFSKPTSYRHHIAVFIAINSLLLRDGKGTNG